MATESSYKLKVVASSEYKVNIKYLFAMVLRDVFHVSATCPLVTFSVKIS